MRLSKKDRRLLEGILQQLERGQAYLRKPDTLVCVRRSVKTTTLDLTNDQGEICAEVNKEIGSELALLHTGIERLRKVLTVETSENPQE